MRDPLNVGSQQVSDPTSIDFVLYPVIAARRDRHVLDYLQPAVGIDQRDGTAQAGIDAEE